MTPHITPAQMLDNITVEDVVRLFTGDGITIPQISNAFEWGQMALAGWSVGSDASRQTEAMQAMILTHEQTSHDDQDRPVLLEPRWWYPSTGASETTVVEETTTMEGLTVQTAHDQVPPEVPVKLPGMPSNRGGWTWLEAPKITKDHQTIMSGGRWSSGMDGVACLLHMTKTQEEEEVKSNLKKGGGSTVLRRAIRAQRKN